MGATTFSTMGHGRTPEEAFSQAHDAATWEYGHGGYSGSLAEKPGFLLVDRLPHWTAERLERAISEYAWVRTPPEFQSGRVKARERNLVAAFVADYGERQAERIATTYDDKWANAIAVEVTGKAKRDYLARIGAHLISEGGVVTRIGPKRGTRVFSFFGWAST